MTSLSDIRREYKSRALSEADAKGDPIAQFAVWFDEAVKSQLLDVNAMSVATASSAGEPSVRTMLLKDYSESGFVFFTNYESAKGRDLDQNPRAALLFFWAELERQVRINGAVSKVSRKESEAYFHSRPFESQVGALASPQSRVVDGRAPLDARLQQLVKEYEGREVPMPAYWGGYRVVPERVEFWQGRAGRLHDRLLYERTSSGWKRSRLAP